MSGSLVYFVQRSLFSLMAYGLNALWEAEPTTRPTWSLKLWSIDRLNLFLEQKIVLLFYGRGEIRITRFEGEKKTVICFLTTIENSPQKSLFFFYYNWILIWVYCNPQMNFYFLLFSFMMLQVILKVKLIMNWKIRHEIGGLLDLMPL